jgi:hypothetical protein
VPVYTINVDPAADATAPGLDNDFQFLVAGSYGCGTGRRPAVETQGDGLNVYASANGDRQCFPLEALPYPVSRITLVECTVYVKVDVVAPSAKFYLYVRTATNTLDGTQRTPTNAFAAYTEDFSLNPDTGLPWTQDELEAAEFGILHDGDGGGADLIAIDYIEVAVTATRKVSGLSSFLVG